MAPRIEDYAMIGNCRSAALVSRDGSIDWLCLPRFDAAACFASLLGDDSHGCWRLAPVDAAAESRREYVDGSLVLRTEWRTATGSARVTDFMPFAGDTDYWPAGKQWMINFRVTDLDEVLAGLRKAEIAIETNPAWDSPETGRFARVYDPEGNPIELWEPPVD